MICIYTAWKSVIKNDFEVLWFKGIQSIAFFSRDIIVEVYCCSPSLSLSCGPLAYLNLSYHILNFFIFEVYSKPQNTFLILFSIFFLLSSFSFFLVVSFQHFYFSIELVWASVREVKKERRIHNLVRVFSCHIVEHVEQKIKAIFKCSKDLR